MSGDLNYIYLADLCCDNPGQFFLSFMKKEPPLQLFPPEIPEGNDFRKISTQYYYQFNETDTISR